MKKRVYIAFVLMSCITFLGGCRISLSDGKRVETEQESQNAEQNDFEAAHQDNNNDQLWDVGENEYISFSDDDCMINDAEITVYANEVLQLTKPSGICIFGDELVISDRENNALYRYDLDCNYLGTVGKQGMAELEFNMPMAMDVYDDQLYVLDSGNYRVQVLNKNYEYVSEIQLNAQNYSNGGGIYWDLAVKNEGCIYVSTSGANGIETRIAKVDAAGQTDFEEVFFGHLCSYEGEIYAVNTMEYIYVDEITEQFQSGEHNIYKIVGNEMELLGTLPMYCTPLDFIIKDEKVYIILSGKDRIDIFNLKGEELKQLCKVNAAYDFQYNEQGITMSSDGTIYYIDGQNCKLFRIPPID